MYVFAAELCELIFFYFLFSKICLRVKFDLVPCPNRIWEEFGAFLFLVRLYSISVSIFGIWNF